MRPSKIALLGRVHGLLENAGESREVREQLAAEGVMSEAERHVRANASLLFAPKQPRGSHACKCGKPISANKTSCRDCL